MDYEFASRNTECLACTMIDEHKIPAERVIRVCREATERVRNNEPPDMSSDDPWKQFAALDAYRARLSELEEKALVKLARQRGMDKEAIEYALEYPDWWKEFQEESGINIQLEHE